VIKHSKKLKDKVTVFNVGSRQQIAERLTSKGAVWKELTPAGKPKVDEATLKKQTDIPEAKIILRYLLCQKRASHVDSWIKAVGEGTEYMDESGTSALSPDGWHTPLRTWLRYLL
jgi:hypothetical protein